jgi:hypothetical protein
LPSRLIVSRIDPLLIPQGELCVNVAATQFRCNSEFSGNTEDRLLDQWLTLFHDAQRDVWLDYAALKSGELARNCRLIPVLKWHKTTPRNATEITALVCYSGDETMYLGGAMTPGWSSQV